MTEAEGREFIQTTLEPTLVKALTALSKEKPESPMVWLANWLAAHNPNKAKINV